MLQVAKARKVVKRKVVMSTKEVAKVLGRAPRTVRRYAQFGILKSAGKASRFGWKFVALVDLEVF